MPTTMAPEGTTEVADRKKNRWRWLWIPALVVVAVVVGLTFFLLASDGDEPTYAYELNGSLDDEQGGPPARQTMGTLGAEGFVFSTGDRLALDVDLGESYTIETRLRIDETPGSNPNAKVFDFRDRDTDAGLYSLGGTQLAFAFVEPCPSGEVDLSQGCMPAGEAGLSLYPTANPRWGLYGPPDSMELGSFYTIRLIRDGEAGTVEVYVDGELQTWSLAGPWHPPWLSDEPMPTEEELAAMQFDRFLDFTGEATQGGGTVLYVMTDDWETAGKESSSGEIDYIHITSP